MAELEQQFADKHTLPEIRRTVFALNATDKDFTFFVAEQEYVNGDVKMPQEKHVGGKPKKEGKKP